MHTVWSQVGHRLTSRLNSDAHHHRTTSYAAVVDHIRLPMTESFKKIACNPEGNRWFLSHAKAMLMHSQSCPGHSVSNAHSGGCARYPGIDPLCLLGLQYGDWTLGWYLDNITRATASSNSSIRIGSGRDNENTNNLDQKETGVTVHCRTIRHIG
ncbi:hypothetical protein CTAM01_05595 [Colletotrichum tamarilloi]|uniref:Uncharacterized protein n=1 Tax=Colletotrichum tamarilloi TaxID=1209934 RepID=A0ABQ9REK9_9PEZI|nr:uncharacterized protein CTAM01_05595 [Colletotrichum tamarilloi]KAK1502157.1 hypothetical protein CTAM01_05595 [Colletotrichum tamarilloi]